VWLTFQNIILSFGCSTITTVKIHYIRHKPILKPIKNQLTTIKTNINIYENTVFNPINPSLKTVSEAGLRADLITLGACVAGVGDWWMAHQRLEHMATEGGFGVAFGVSNVAEIWGKWAGSAKFGR
jgi:hypothetical protein